MKKIIAILVAVLMSMISLFGGCKNNATTPEKTFMFLDNEITLFVGESAEIIKGSSFDGISFSSDNTAIATVDSNGVVTAVSAGQTQISVSDLNQTVKVEIIVSEKTNITANVALNESDAVYSFEIKTDGLYNFKLAESSFDAIASLSDNVVFNFDDNYSTRLKSRKINEDNQIEIGTKYLKKGTHSLTIKNANEYLNVSKIIASKALTYSEDALDLGRAWWNILYQESFYTTNMPNYMGIVEAYGWEDIWTHCQYLPYFMYVADVFDDAEYDRRLKKIADDFLIGKMLRSDGAVYTIYRADSDVFNVSIEPDMPTNKYELWRGQSAFIEEMINCYLYTKDNSYLEYAETAADYILNSWSKTNVSGIFGGIYTRYSSSAGGTIDIMSSGRNVMVFAQLYEITGKSEYLSAAKQQAKVLLKAQEAKYEEFDGMFASDVDANGNLGEFRHGNAYANAMLGLAWMYKTTGEIKYLEAIDKAIKVLPKVYDDEYGLVALLNGQLLYNDTASTGQVYLAGRIGQAIMTCAAFVGNEDYYAEGERVLEFALGRNLKNIHFQNNRGGFNYNFSHYETGYGRSNNETSGEIYLALMQYYYLSEIWGFELK